MSRRLAKIGRTKSLGFASVSEPRGSYTDADQEKAAEYGRTPRRTWPKRESSVPSVREYCRNRERRREHTNLSRLGAS